jgi:hypothetical protein
MTKHPTAIRNLKDGSLRVRIGGAVFNHGDLDIKQTNAQQKVKEQIIKIVQGGGAFDYVIAYPKDSHPICAVKKGMKPEHYPELMEAA